MYLLLFLSSILLLLLFLLVDLNARQSLNRFKKVVPNDYQVNTIPRLKKDPVWQYMYFFYQMVIIKTSEFEFTQRFLEKNDNLKTRSGNLFLFHCFDHAFG